MSVRSRHVITQHKAPRLERIKAKCGALLVYRGQRYLHFVTTDPNCDIQVVHPNQTVEARQKGVIDMRSDRLYGENFTTGWRFRFVAGDFREWRFDQGACSQLVSITI